MRCWWALSFTPCLKTISENPIRIVRWIHRESPWFVSLYPSMHNASLTREPNSNPPQTVKHNSFDSIRTSKKMCQSNRINSMNIIINMNYRDSRPKLAAQQFSRGEPSRPDNIQNKYKYHTILLHFDKEHRMERESIWFGPDTPHAASILPHAFVHTPKAVPKNGNRKRIVFFNYVIEMFIASCHFENYFVSVVFSELRLGNDDEEPRRRQWHRSTWSDKKMCFSSYFFFFLSSSARMRFHLECLRWSRFKISFSVYFWVVLSFSGSLSPLIMSRHKEHSPWPFLTSHQRCRHRLDQSIELDYSLIDYCAGSFLVFNGMHIPMERMSQLLFGSVDGIA